MPWTHSLKEVAQVTGCSASVEDIPFNSVSTDTRVLPPGSLFFALRGDNFDGADYVEQAFQKGAVAAVTTRPDSSGPCLVTQDPLRVLQDFAAHHRSLYTIHLFAITGSCGKTSTKDMVAAVLSTRYRVVNTRGNLNNEIGCPLTLMEIDETTEHAVIEMGANHMGEIARLCELARPDASAITMIAPAHLEGFGSIDNVARAKGEIIDALPGDGVFYVNMDDPRCVELSQKHHGLKVCYGRSGDVQLRSLEESADGELVLDIKPIGPLTLPLHCPDHVHNVLLAIAVGLTHGITDVEDVLHAACRRSIRFQCMEIGGIHVIDDTYNANPASMSAALRTLCAGNNTVRKVAALGDMLELGDASEDFHRELGKLAGTLGVDALFARGDFASSVVAAAREAGIKRAEVIQEHKAIADTLADYVQPGDRILLKGSRGMRMELVLEHLREQFGAT